MENKIIELQTFKDNRGALTVIEKLLPFDIKRVFYIYDVDSSIRGGHRHKETIQALICIKGSCDILCQNELEEEVIRLNNPSKCLILQPDIWHQMYHFSKGAVLLVLASKEYDKNDYITEKYK